MRVADGWQLIEYVLDGLEPDEAEPIDLGPELVAAALVADLFRARPNR